jgi:uncharacterized protein YggE
MRFLLTAVTVGLAVTAGRADERVISTTGTATIYAKPDVARIYYGVRVSEPSADAVRDVLGKTTTAIDEAVKKLKLPAVTVTTAPVSIKQSSGNQNGLNVAPAPPGGGAPAPGLGPFLGYTSHTATIGEKDPEKLRAAVDSFVKAVTEAGANTGGGEEKESNIGIVLPGQEQTGGPKVVLAREDDSDAREQALQKAVEKAMKSARAIAKGLGGNEVKVLSVSDAPEADKAGPESMMSMIYGIESGTAPRVPAGQVEVKVRVVVKVSY